ncbi:hypothetical protein ACP4OV_013519 [Aristida adscensionis]
MVHCHCPCPPAAHCHTPAPAFFNPATFVLVNSMIRSSSKQVSSSGGGGGGGGGSSSSSGASDECFVNVPLLEPRPRPAADTSSVEQGMAVGAVVLGCIFLVGFSVYWFFF